MLSRVSGQTENTSSIELNINNISSIAGYPATESGSPLVVETEEYGNVLWFDGVDDGLLVKSNPLEGAESFTIEVIFKPDSTYPDNVEQRFVHIQDPGNGDRRILIELRMTKGNKWYLDTFIKADKEKLTLAHEKSLHPAGVWTHAALVYERGEMTHYVNGVKEISGNINYLPVTNAFISVGTRMDQRSWFKGSIAILRITHKALSSDEFKLVESME